MKYARNKAFPHPVLREDSRDYENRAFQATFSPEIRKNGEVDISASFILSEERLLRLIKEKKAAYAVIVDCPTTFTRTFQKTHSDSLRLSFSRGELHGDAECCGYVLATGKTPALRSPNFNEEFGVARFAIEPGDVLAICEPWRFILDTDDIPPIESIFNLVALDSQQPGEFSLSWESQKIQILMHWNDLAKFNAVRKQREVLPHLLLGIYLSALMETLREMATNKDTHQSKKWYRAIKRKCDNIDPPIEIDDESADYLMSAQRLFNKPLSRLPAMNGEYRDV